MYAGNIFETRVQHIRVFDLTFLTMDLTVDIDTKIRSPKIKISPKMKLFFCGKLLFLLKFVSFQVRTSQN